MSVDVCGGPAEGLSLRGDRLDRGNRIHRVDTDSAPLRLRHGGPRQQWALHEPIAAAVLAGDAEAAREAVRRHHEVMLTHLPQSAPPGR
jgi:DNA-binding GntR family transcriptional regulator